MRKIEEAQKILQMLGLPKAQQNEISALTLLALCDLKTGDRWQKTTNKSLTLTKGIMVFIEENYERQYAPNTRETFRRQVLHQFIQANIVDYNPDNPDLPTNSPRAHYALTSIAAKTIRLYGARKWNKAIEKFKADQGSLREKYRKRRDSHLVPVRLPNGKHLKLSPGKHNELQAAVIEQFAPRFAPGALLIYLGDTAKKTLFVDEKQLSSIGLSITDHDKMPDIVLHDKKHKRLFLIEVITSHGPMNPKRHMELEKMFSSCTVGKIYVSAFPDFSQFRKYINEIAWETEVWLAEIPDHLIHYDGNAFLNPR